MGDENTKPSGIICEYQNFANELIMNQFIAGLTDALRVTLIGKGQRDKTTQEKVKLREVVEVAKAFEANAFANQLMKTTRNTWQVALAVTVFLMWRETLAAPSIGIIALQWGKNVENAVSLAITFRARLQGWNTTTSSAAVIQFCLIRHNRGSLTFVLCFL